MSITLLPAATPTGGHNFLSLCQLVQSLADISGAPMVTTRNQTGELALVVQWTRQAWLDIQIKRQRWNFMRKPLSFQTVAGKAKYTLLDIGAADLRSVDEDSMRTYLASTGVSDEQWLVEWDWQSWYDTYEFGVQTPSRPMVFAVDPQTRALALGSVPDDIYTVRGWYYQQAVVLREDADVPAIPDELRPVIAYRALLKYANFDAAPEVKQSAREEYTALMRALERDWLPTVNLPEPLA